MLKKTIKYKDLFTEEEVSEDCFFHLSKAELVEMEMSTKDGLAESLQKVIDAEDGKQIIAEFKNIILSAYGKRSDDGRRFIKNQQLRDEFESSEAYSTLFMELVTNTGAAIEFINGIIPKKLDEEAIRITALAAVPAPEPEIVTSEDVAKMNSEQLKELGARIISGEVKLGEREVTEVTEETPSEPPQ